jgi:hypothetical protein
MAHTLAEAQVEVTEPVKQYRTNSADKAAHDRIVTLVNAMLQLQPRLAPANTTHDRAIESRRERRAQCRS